MCFHFPQGNIPGFQVLPLVMHSPHHTDKECLLGVLEQILLLSLCGRSSEEQSLPSPTHPVMSPLSSPAFWKLSAVPWPPVPWLYSPSIQYSTCKSPHPHEPLLWPTFLHLSLLKISLHNTNAPDSKVHAPALIQEPGLVQGGETNLLTSTSTASVRTREGETGRWLRRL